MSSFQASFCFSEHHLFLLASALLSGITTGINYNFFSENYVAFPIIYKEKSSQIKEKLVPILQNSVLKGLRVSKMFYPMYIATCLLLRSNPTSLIMDCFNLHLFCMLLIITTLLFTVNSTMLTVFGIAACEPLDLNLEEVRNKWNIFEKKIALGPILFQAVAGLDKKGTTPLQCLLSLQQLAHLTGKLYFLSTIGCQCYCSLSQAKRSQLGLVFLCLASLVVIHTCGTRFE